MADDREDFGEDFERLDRDIHRQILERLNAARRPEDLQDLGLDEPKARNFESLDPFSSSGTFSARWLYPFETAWSRQRHRQKTD